ncbi:Gfo/Idh/MocA family protein [Cohnella sp. WQ 127256]|uniref:Gfo/Idh/MocA family protein n=1 Tax=Cohnella sp. WQ 127256 TaxID=2938790 RepID=UPI0021173586|nr:Gfo/Idh/MocA family oxidoreductase [Cohnella sp. WQ 127256]
MSKVKVALIGAGLRGHIYTEYALSHPDEMQLVAVADPNRERREKFKELHGIEDAMCFETGEDLLALPKLADAILICTQDKLHYEPTMKALDVGYHVLLEKPMSPDPLQCIEMEQKARSSGLTLTICHVLRYTNFFGMLKRLLDEGAIGQLMSIQHNENVGYWHQAHSFVRGNWGNSVKSSPMILAKSCHDMDALLWLAGTNCVRISSFGDLSYFNAVNAPVGAPKRCMDGCPIADECLYYAPKVYLAEDAGWMALAISDDQSEEARLKALKEGPYGRCVYHCDNDVVDHQVVNIEFEGGVTAAFTMSAFTKECSRTLKLMGTKGEIRGAMEKNEIELIRFDKAESEFIVLDDLGGHAGHGGGDAGLMRDFVNLLKVGGSGAALSSAEHSVQSHLMAFAAEQSRVEKRVIEMKAFMV